MQYIVDLILYVQCVYLLLIVLILGHVNIFTPQKATELQQFNLLSTFFC